VKVDLRSERLNQGLSLVDLADQIGVPKSTIARAEKGIMPRPETAFKIAQHFGYRVTDIWPVDLEEVPV
jgi:DNA-binding XRE family transcriptional regulator